jgi:ubiquinone/menaquinone biosynthesis C-methylase UbiE
MDALAMGFPDNSFDLVWACESGEHMPDKKAYVEEMARVLAPGGQVGDDIPKQCGCSDDNDNSNDSRSDSSSRGGNSWMVHAIDTIQRGLWPHTQKL